MRTFDAERIPIINPNLPHQIKLSGDGGGLYVSCNCGMPKQSFHPEKNEDPRDIYDEWHKNPPPARDVIRGYG